jgi:hypothetical protein
MCRPDEYPPFDGEEVGAMLRARELEDVAYDPHEDHAEQMAQGVMVPGCNACEAYAERQWHERYE